MTRSEFLELETLVRQACARAYCHPDNMNKPLDCKLLNAITREVVNIPMFLEAVRLGVSHTHTEFNELEPCGFATHETREAQSETAGGKCVLSDFFLSAPKE